MLTKIVSGGQTGVDRGALDAALEAQFPCGGWCPEGRQAEDGRIHQKYPLVELAGSGYRQRTLKNVQDSDGTMILFTGVLSGGTKLTRDCCVKGRKPFVIVDAVQVSLSEAIDGALRFIEENRIRVLNVAGPRVSGWGEGYDFALNMVDGIIKAATCRQPGVADTACSADSLQGHSLKCSSSRVSPRLYEGSRQHRHLGPPRFDPKKVGLAALSDVPDVLILT